MNNMIEFPRNAATKAILLARVSSKDQEDGYSLEAQKHRLHVYCEKRKLEVIRVFEITESSTSGDRRRFMEMIKYCKSQKQSIAIVADKVDRVQRSFKEYPLLNDLIQSGKIELHFNTEGYVIHRDSVSQERLMWSFGVIMAQSYVDSLRDNVKRSIEHKIRKGEYVSTSPLGYLNVRDQNGRADIVVDETRGVFIRRLFSEFSTGLYTLAHITKVMGELGLRTRSGKPVSRSQIHLILQNPFYYGLMRVKGKIFPHRYPPLISKHLFEQCKAVLEAWHKKPFGYAEKSFVFRGLVTCKVNGRTVTPFTKRKEFKNGNKGEWTYLQSWDTDGVKRLYVKEEKAMEQVKAALEKIVIPPKTYEAIVQCLKTSASAERSFLRRRIEELRREDDKIENRVAALVDLFADKAISAEDYNARRSSLQQRRIEITQEIAANRDGDDSFNDAFMLLLEMCQNIGEAFEKADTEEKRTLINFVLQNLSLDGEKLCYSYRKPFSDFVEMGENEKWWALLECIRTNAVARQDIIELIHSHVMLLFPIFEHHTKLTKADFEGFLF